MLAFFLQMLRSNEHCKWVEIGHMVGIEGYFVWNSSSDNSSIMQLTSAAEQYPCEVSLPSLNEVCMATAKK